MYLSNLSRCTVCSIRTRRRGRGRTQSELPPQTDQESTYCDSSRDLVFCEADNGLRAVAQIWPVSEELAVNVRECLPHVNHDRVSFFLSVHLLHDFVQGCFHGAKIFVAIAVRYQHVLGPFATICHEIPTRVSSRAIRGKKRFAREICFSECGVHFLDGL